MMVSDPGDYYHGDRTTVSNKAMLNDFEILSSGEVIR